MLGEHGFTSKVLPYYPSSSVPLFILGPNVKARTDENLILNIDMAPTILELAGVEVPKNIHGKSLKEVITDKERFVRNAFVYEGMGNYGGAKPNLTVVSKEYRYIVTYEDKSLSKAIFEELYNQKNDPDEMHNLAKNTKMKEIIKQMDSEIENHRKEILSID
jgi:arylsulfatase A-like enzyme